MKLYKYLIILIAVVIIAAISVSFLNKKSALEVNVMKSYKGTITNAIEVSGVIDSNEIEVIPLEVGRKVIKTYVKENDVVKENQLLAELDTSDIDLSLEKAKVNLEDLNIKLNNLTTDKSNTILLNNALARSNEEYLIVSADLLTATENFKKAKNLYDENTISKADFDKYAIQVDKLTSNLKKAELNLNDATENYKNNEEEKKQNISSLQRQIMTLELDIKSLNKKIEDSKIYSNTEGYITEFPLEESNKIIAGQKITIYGTSSYELKAKVIQQDAVLIKEGFKSSINIGGLSTRYEGIVTFVSKTAAADNNGSEPKIEIRIQITNPDDSIIFGYEGKADIMIDSVDNAVILKNECIKKEDNNKFVYIVDENVAKKIYVETGITDRYITNITSGISENDVVILNPPLNLTEGINVKVMN